MNLLGREFTKNINSMVQLVRMVWIRVELNVLKASYKLIWKAMKRVISKRKIEKDSEEMSTHLSNYFLSVPTNSLHHNLRIYQPIKFSDLIKNTFILFLLWWFMNKSASNFYLWFHLDHFWTFCNENMNFLHWKDE